MRLSGWRASAPFKESVSTKVLAVVGETLVALGADVDPECWVVWGDDPAARYLLFVPTPSGLAQVNVRVNVPGEGPRAGGKIIRWNRVQFGELAVEVHGGHRLVTFQVETQALHGADAEADAIAAFAQILFAAVDGRPIEAPTRAPRRRSSTPKARSLVPARGGPAPARGSTSSKES